MTTVPGTRGSSPAHHVLARQNYVDQVNRNLTCIAGIPAGPHKPEWKRKPPFALGILALALLLCRETASTPAQRPPEYQVKSVYLYNFGKFVQWPSSEPSSAFKICVLGEDPFGPLLDQTISGETISGKPAEAKRIRKVQDAGDCNVLYISWSEQRRLSQILLLLEGKSILTVSDMDEFVNRGGIIQFVWDHDRIRFEINLAAAMRARLAVSSELLKVATKVIQAG